MSTSAPAFTIAMVARFGEISMTISVDLFLDPFIGTGTVRMLSSRIL